MDEVSVRAGDPFVAAAKHRHDPDDETPHGCYDGVVFLGFEGEEGEVIERVPCRRCHAENL